MSPGPEADALYLEQVLALVALVRQSLAQATEASFMDDLDKADATALRLASIGEISRKLSADIKTRHPNIDWAGMSKLRNIVAHHYDRLDYRRIWGIAINALGDLETVCRSELDALGQ